MILENNESLRNVYLYTPNKIIEDYYIAYSTPLTPDLRKFIREELIRGKESVVTRGISAYSAMTGIDVFEALANHKKQFYNCKYTMNPVSMPNLVINPIKIKNKAFFGRKFEFMKWIAQWAQKQEIGGQVWIKNNSYYSKVKGYLIGEGYEEINDNVMIRTMATISNDYWLL